MPLLLHFLVCLCFSKSKTVFSDSFCFFSLLLANQPIFTHAHLFLLYITEDTQFQEMHVFILVPSKVILKDSVAGGLPSWPAQECASQVFFMVSLCHLHRTNQVQSSSHMF